jgi:hypothetical protein
MLTQLECIALSDHLPLDAHISVASHMTRSLDFSAATAAIRLGKWVADCVAAGHSYCDVLFWGGGGWLPTDRAERAVSAWLPDADPTHFDGSVWIVQLAYRLAWRHHVSLHEEIMCDGAAFTPPPDGSDRFWAPEVSPDDDETPPRYPAAPAASTTPWF